MSTPTPAAAAPLPLPAASAEEMQNELERMAMLQNLQRGLSRARALDDQTPPPAASPRDLSSLDTALVGAHAAQAYFFAHPGWTAIQQIDLQVSTILSNLSVRAERTPQAAIQASRITVLAASLIARHAAQIGQHLDKGRQRDTPGSEAMRQLTRAAEGLAAQAAGIEQGQKLDTPRLLLTHMNQLQRELDKTRESPHRAAGSTRLDDPDDPALDAAVTAGAALDPELAEASKLMSALTELAAGARRVGHRVTLDVKLHGAIETVQLRGFEMISGIARAAMNRYDRNGRGNDGRRTIAAMVYHYAEQRLERMRGTLDEGEQRAHGYYEGETRDRYFDALFEESRTVLGALKTEGLTPQEQTDLQIRYLLAEHAIAARLDEELPMEASFPPKPWVAGLSTDTPVATRRALIDALHRRVHNDPYNRDAHFLNRAADLLALELAGPTELTPRALEAAVTAIEIRAIAQHLVDHDTVAAPLVLSEIPELNVSHAQAERALDVLQRLNVVGPPNGPQPRATTVAADSLPERLMLLEVSLPDMLRLQEEAGQPTTDPETPSMPPSPTATQSPTPPAPSGGVSAASADSAPGAAQAPVLPQRRRDENRPHPGSPAGTGNGQTASADGAQADVAPGNVAQWRMPSDAQLQAIKRAVIDGAQDRADRFPAPAEATAPNRADTNEDQRNAQTQQQATGATVR